jgi:hypothetical protein
MTGRRLVGQGWVVLFDRYPLPGASCAAGPSTGPHYDAGATGAGATARRATGRAARDVPHALSSRSTPASHRPT